MNKTEILKLVNEYLSEQDIIYANSVYQKSKVRKKVTRTTASLRTIADNEIVIEFDSDNPKRGMVLAKRMTKRLRYLKYAFVVYKAEGQRSPHIHIYNIKGLNKVDLDINREYKRRWFERYCRFNETDTGINTKESSLLAIEDKPHFKYGTKKEFIYAYLPNDSVENRLDLELLKDSREHIIELRERVREEIQETNNYDNTWFVEWITSEKLPQGKRHSTILKNLAIHLENNNLNDDKIVNKLIDMYDHTVYRQIRGWRAWAQKEKRFFGMNEIMTYLDDNDMSLSTIFDKYKYMNKTKKNDLIGKKLWKRKSPEVAKHVIRKFS